MKNNFFACIVLILTLPICTAFLGKKNNARLSREFKSEKVTLNDTSKYAVIYIYRPKKWKYHVNSYSVNVGDSLLSKVKNNSKFIFKAYKEGSTEIWAQIADKKSVINLNLKFGQEYYIKCSFNMGFAMNYPDLILMSKGEGKEECDAINEKN